MYEECRFHGKFWAVPRKCAIINSGVKFGSDLRLISQSAFERMKVTEEDRMAIGNSIECVFMIEYLGYVTKDTTEEESMSIISSSYQ